MLLFLYFILSLVLVYSALHSLHKYSHRIEHIHPLTHKYTYTQWYSMTKHSLLRDSQRTCFAEFFQNPKITLSLLNTEKGSGAQLSLHSVPLMSVSCGAAGLTWGCYGTTSGSGSSWPCSCCPSSLASSSFSSTSGSPDEVGQMYTSQLVVLLLLLLYSHFCISSHNTAHSTGLMRVSCFIWLILIFSTELTEACV